MLLFMMGVWIAPAVVVLGLGVRAIRRASRSKRRPGTAQSPSGVDGLAVQPWSAASAASHV
jgi:hypothetical protein